MIKTKMIIDKFTTCDNRLDAEINDFIEKNKAKVIDIKFTSVNCKAAALIIYEVSSNE